ncbi:YlcI/YnfO family protein [Cellulomonas sp. HZM]|uniref:YlcI/YnfO family protein n=1 Tax=Cellulomonas sp. HZM TaxID=1454010 RepID=UPI000493296C|nr:YlcI/YnfO family protein [Cellulomonas sp. HZM]
MTTQITVRLPDELVAFADRLVAAGRARSRAAVVEAALAHELRRAIAERDVSILTNQPVDADLDDLAAWARRSLSMDN